MQSPLMPVTPNKDGSAILPTLVYNFPTQNYITTHFVESLPIPSTQNYALIPTTLVPLTNLVIT